MSVVASLDKVKAQAKDLSQEPPRSAYSTEVAGIVLMARILDKCRSQLVGLSPNPDMYEFRAPADRGVFQHFNLDFDAFEAFVATGASDAEVSQWILEHASHADETSIAVYNNEWKSKRLSDLPAEIQLVLSQKLAMANQPERTARLRYLIDVLDFKDSMFN
jgi:hypothetical protein